MSSPKCTAEAAVLPDGCLALRLSEGVWRPEPDTAVVVWRGGTLETIAYPPNTVEVPQAARGTAGYALATRATRLRFGAAGIGTVVARAFPRVEASLGMNGNMELCLAHATGLWQLLDDGRVEALRWDEALRRLDEKIAAALREACRVCCGDMPWNGVALKAALEGRALREVAAKRLFRAIYPYGLSAPPGQTRLLGMAFSDEDV